MSVHLANVLLNPSALFNFMKRPRIAGDEVLAAWQRPRRRLQDQQRPSGR
jgi:hypothetical protein